MSSPDRTTASDRSRAQGSAGQVGHPRVVVLPDEEALSREAADLFVETVSRAIAERGRADVALTGGSSATGFYRALAEPETSDRVDWERVHLWWGDDRYVPSTHPDSNVKLAYDDLFSFSARANESGDGTASTDVEAGKAPGVPIPAGNVHPFPIDEAIGRGPDEAAWAAERYADELRAALPERDGKPAFDLVLLGIGPDGHILSVFPDSAVLDGDAIAAAVPAPEHIGPHVRRVTLDPRLLSAAGTIVLMVPGERKAGIVGELFRAPADPTRLPAQLALRPNAIWLLDEAAAGQLPESVAVARPR